MKQMPSSLSECLQMRAKNQPYQLAYRFLKDGENDEVEITYQELDQHAKAIAGILQESTKIGDRALLLLPVGLDFIAAYFGCLYAKVIAVPVPPPHPVRLEKSLSTIFRIIKDATPSTVILNTPLFNAIKAKANIAEQFRGIKLLVSDEKQLTDWADRWEKPLIEGKDIAFLQYTSGSTNSPKGVMVSHNNLLHNLNFIETSFCLTKKSRTVFWLPPFHDMGLIGGILQPIYTGYPVTLIPHMLFVQRPIRWLKAITRFQATASGGPNFAYDLCVKKIKPEQREQLDLSTWEIAFNGAEPIYHKTLDRFADYFASCGFRKEAFFPCYGLAESTLMVTSGSKTRLPVTKTIIKSELEENRVIPTTEINADSTILVSCGQNIGDQKVKIVDVETLKLCPPNQVGEIWIKGESVASGYWNKREETASIFGAKLSEPNEGPFLRTGDLGFISEGELYVTGRLKSLIIIDGKNHYPHDIERTIEQLHPMIRPLGCAVFSIEKSGKERVVVLVEIRHKLANEQSEIIKTIKRAVSENHGIPVFDIRLTLPGSIKRTTSGKIRHFLCKKHYLSETLNEITLS